MSAGKTAGAVAVGLAGFGFAKWLDAKEKAGLNHALAVWSGRAQVLERERDQQTRRADVAEGNLAARIAEVSRLNSALSASNSEKSSLLADVVGKDRTIATLQQTISARDAENAALKAQVARLERELAARAPVDGASPRLPS